MAQAESLDRDNRRVLAWQLDTNQGPKHTYSATADEARRKAEARGLVVRSVKPGKPLIG